MSWIDNYSNNISSVFNSNEDVLVKEFRDGQVQQKSLPYRLLSKAQSILLRAIDLVGRTHLLENRKEAKIQQLVRQNWEYHRNPQATLPINVRPINEAQLRQAQAVTAQFAKQIGNPDPLQQVQRGIDQWLRQDNRFIHLIDAGKAAYAAIYGSGIDPAQLRDLAEKDFSIEPLTDPEELVTLAQVLNIYQTVVDYKEYQFPPELSQFILENPDQSWSLNQEAVNAAQLTPEDVTKLNQYVATHNLMPHEMVANIVNVGSAYRANPNLLLNSPFREDYIRKLQQRKLPENVKIDSYGQPVPLKQQLRCAVEEAYRLFDGVSRFENDESRAFFARTIQYLLVGEKLPYVSEPTDDCCFTYHEIYVDPEKSEDMRSPNFTVDAIKKAGNVASALTATLVDVQRGGHPNTKIELNGHIYDYPRSKKELFTFVDAFRKDFQQKAQDPAFKSHFEAIRSQLPVKQEQYEQLIQDVRALNLPDEIDRTIVTDVLNAYGFVNRNDPDLNECWRVNLLQLLIHMNQRMSAEIVRNEMALGANAEVRGLMVQPQNLVIKVDQMDIQVYGFAELQASEDLFQNHRHLPNFTVENGNVGIVRTGTIFTAHLKNVEGVRSESILHSNRLIPPHLVITPDVLNHLEENDRPYRDRLMETDKLVEELQKISSENENVKHLLQEKPKSWNDLKTVVQCMNIRLATEYLMKDLIQQQTQYEPFMRITREGIWQVKPEFVPGKAGGRTPLTQEAYSDVKECVEMMNRLKPYFELMKDIKTVIELNQEPDRITGFEEYHREFVEECEESGVPTEVVIKENTPYPTSQQLDIAFALLQRQLEGNFPKPDSPLSRAFVGRFLQLVLVGEQHVQQLPYPREPYFTTEELSKTREIVSAGPIGGIDANLLPEGIIRRVKAFPHQQSKIYHNDRIYDFTPNVLGDMMPAMKNEFFEWCKDADNRDLIESQLADFSRIFKLKNEEEVFQKIKEILCESDLEGYEETFRDALKGEFTRGNVLWAMHLLQIVLMSQPNFGQDILYQNKKNLFSEELMVRGNGLRHGIYRMEGGLWSAQFFGPLLIRKGEKDFEIELTLGVAPMNIHDFIAHVNLSIGDIFISPETPLPVEDLEKLIAS